MISGSSRLTAGTFSSNALLGTRMILISNKTLEIHVSQILEEPSCMDWPTRILSNSISGLVVEYIVAIDVTRVRFPADALWWQCIHNSILMATLHCPSCSYRSISDIALLFSYEPTHCRAAESVDKRIWYIQFMSAEFTSNHNHHLSPSTRNVIFGFPSGIIR